MKRDDIELVGTKCEICGDVLENGARALCLEESIIGRTGFVPLPDRQDWLLFCGEPHFLDHDIPGEGGTKFRSLISKGSTPNEFKCDDCGSPLGYGKRALRLQDGNIDGVGFVPLTNRDDWFLFCSKECADNFVDEPSWRRPRRPPRIP